mmetsp:Transcript_64592/g.203884  ORF Transcript_64592/g.203884 Transcript_64592/m.203884 type:complete len:91 (+) Transcript_64592:838-1110(+)
MKAINQPKIVFILLLSRLSLSPCNHTRRSAHQQPFPIQMWHYGALVEDWAVVRQRGRSISHVTKLQNPRPRPWGAIAPRCFGEGIPTSWR